MLWMSLIDLVLKTILMFYYVSKMMEHSIRMTMISCYFSSFSFNVYKTKPFSNIFPYFPLS